MNKELKKIKDKAKGKGIIFGEDNKTSDNDERLGTSTTNTKKVKKEKPFMITSKNQLLANMLMEYEGVVRRQCESQKLVKARKFTLKRTSKTDSVRVRTSDNREEYFTYMQ